MDRRTFLGTVGATTIGLTIPSSLIAPAHAGSVRIIRELPSWGEKRTAWTVDDGTSPEAVRRYIRLVAENDLRLTFFIYSAMGSWLANKRELQPLVDSGQIQLANHTAHHPALAGLSTKEIQKELQGAHNFIEKHFGVDARPFYRPPYGSINKKVVNAAADIGYTMPMLWSGSLGDASNIRSGRLLTLAKSSFYDGSIVLAHANNLTAPSIFPRLLKVINGKELQLVTLTEAFDEV
ncbi:MAG: polysaccharide deacetylase family protein [Actinomycetota bacterium]